jgi:predicted RNase H-like HicB family nuclease
MFNQNQYTVIVRKSRLEYIAVCLELNVTACGSDLADVEKNLEDALKVYLEDVREHPDTVVKPMSTEELIEFLRDTEPEWYGKLDSSKIFRPFEIHEVPAYV